MLILWFLFKDKPGTLMFVDVKNTSFSKLKLKISYKKKISHFSIKFLEALKKSLSEEIQSEKIQLKLFNPKVPLGEPKVKLDFNNNHIEKYNKRKTKNQET